MADLDLGTLSVKIDANTQAFERAILKMEAMTKSVTDKMETDNNKTSRSVDNLNNNLAKATKGALGLGFAMKAIKFSVIGGAIGPVASSLIALGGATVVALDSLRGFESLIYTLPVALGSLVQGVGAAAAGVLGMVGAFTALQEIYDETDPAERLKKIAEAEKKYGKAALTFALYVKNELKPAFEGLARVSSEELWPRMERGIREAMKNFGLLEEMVQRTSRVIGYWGEQFGKYFGSEAFGNAFSQLSGCR